MPVYQLTQELIFPPPEDAEPEGLLAVGGDLSKERVLLAYSMGIFPWYDEGDPVLWWSPDPRMVIRPEEFTPSKSLKRAVKKNNYRVTLDTAFKDVIRQCAKIPRHDQNGTWITRDMLDTYTALHQAGYAHSIEIREDETLVGGLYGLSMGSCFFGESMFSTRSDASKIAFYTLSRILTQWGFTLIDCQLHNQHLERLGAYTIPRHEYLHILSESLQNPTRIGSWTTQGSVFTG